MHPYYRIEFEESGEARKYDFDQINDVTTVVRWALLVSNKVTVEKVKE